MGNGVTHCEWRHAPEACGGFWEILKKSVSWELDTEWDGWLSLTRGDLCGGGGGRLKSQNRKIVPLSLCRRTLKLKSNKKVRTWTKKSSSVFRVSRSYVLCDMCYVCNEHPMYISHIHVYGHGIQVVDTKAHSIVSHNSKSLHKVTITNMSGLHIHIYFSPPINP